VHIGRSAGHSQTEASIPASSIEASSIDASIMASSIEASAIASSITAPSPASTGRCTTGRHSPWMKKVPSGHRSELHASKTKIGNARTSALHGAGIMIVLRRGDGSARERCLGGYESVFVCARDHRVRLERDRR